MMADIGLSAFSIFFMGSPSFLAHQRALEEGLGRSNCETLFAMSAIPSDNYIRLMLDGAPTAAFDGLFMQAIEAAGPLTDNHDLMTQGGNWAEVSGFDALPQQVKTCLSHQKGESPFYRDFGTRFADYYRLFSGSPWFERLLKLEVIRQAAIPHVDTINKRQHTPLECVERVFGIQVLAKSPTKNWLPIRVDLYVACAAERNRKPA